MQNGSDMLIHDEILKIAAAGVKLHHLADLLFKCHTREQVGDSLTSGTNQDSCTVRFQQLRQA